MKSALKGLPDQSEAALHRQVVDWLAMALPKGALVHHSPNEGKRGFKAQRDVREMAVLRGFPDLVIFWEGSVYFMELKARRGRMSADQSAVIVQLMDMGFNAGVVRSLAGADACLRSWGVPLRTAPLH